MDIQHAPGPLQRSALQLNQDTLPFYEYAQVLGLESYALSLIHYFVAGFFYNDIQYKKYQSHS